MIEPRYYQIEAHKATFDYLKNKEGNPLIALPTGTGKAMQLSMFVMNILMENPRQKILVVTHVSELIEQNAKELLNLWHTAPVGINSAALNRRDFNNNVIFCGIASIVKDWEKFGKVDFIIVDECFSGDTLISTPNGFKRIDQVSIGDVVYNAIGTGIVKSVSIKNTNTTYKVSLSNGTEITTTDNHPIFTQYGWIKARDLDKRHIVFSLQDLRKLRTKNIPMEKKSRYSKKWEVVQKSRKSSVTTSFRKNKILLNKLLETERECHVDSWSKRKNEGNINKNRSQTKNTRWEWKRINQSSRNYAKYTRGWMDFRIGYKNKSWTQQSSISELLQSGYREYRFKNSNRVGRWFTCREKKRTRQEKRQFSNFIRVEGVSIEKSRSSTSMFNLQVSGHPSYFAGGILVHNCHLISPKKETMYGSLISNLTKINPLLRVIGYTATPYRLGQGLLTDGGIFNNICYNLTDINGINNLIREGYMTTLIPPKTNYELDISGVNIGFDGDFAKVELQRAVDKYEITLAALKEARDRAEDRHCWLTFASGIEHCEHISEIQESLGISNVVIHSKITQKEREHRFNLWMTGKVKSVIGYRVLTTGLNHPPVDCIIDLYPTTSTSMHVQKLGRGTRPYNPDIQIKYRENFPYLKENCIAEGQLVLTDKGLIPIELVSLNMKLWDGIEFVSHDGLIYKGKQNVIEYAGLTATPDHKVWTKKGWKTLWNCSIEQTSISVTGIGRKGIQQSDNHYRGNNSKKINSYRSAMFNLQKNIRKRLSFCDGKKSRLWTLWKFENRKIQYPKMVSSKMYFRTTKMLQSERSKIQRLWWPWSKFQFFNSYRNGSLYSRCIRFTKRTSNRSNKQQSWLSAWKFKICNSNNKCEQPTWKKSNCKNTRLQNKASQYKICRQNISEIFSYWYDRRRNNRSILQCEINKTKRRVWDIRNAGPRNRFTVSGLLVSNCLVLDFSRNTARLGPINDPVMPRKKGEKGSGGAPVKVCNTCGCYNHASARFCIGCNAEFTLEVKIKDEVSHAELIKSDVPELKTYKVDHITYSEHKKVGGKPSLKVSYFSGLKIFTEYVCIEHDVGSYPKRKADNWWLTRSGTTSPNSILSAIYITDQLLKPVSIIVNVNKKYPEIVDYIFNDKIQLTSKKEQPVLIELEDIPF